MTESKSDSRIETTYDFYKGEKYVRSETSFENEKKEGIERGWRAPGYISFERDWKAGIKEGFTVFYIKRRIATIAYFKDDSLVWAVPTVEEAVKEGRDLRPLFRDERYKGISDAERDRFFEKSELFCLRVSRQKGMDKGFDGRSRE